MAISTGRMKIYLKHFVCIFAALMVLTGCKNRKEDAIFTTDDVNPYVRGNTFYMGEKGYSIEIPRLYWLVVENGSKQVDLTLHNRSYPATVEVSAGRTFLKGSFEKIALKTIERFFKKGYKIVDRREIEIKGQKGIEIRARGEIKLKEYRSYVPREISCSVVRRGSFVYSFSFICKPEEYNLSYPEFALLLGNFKFEKITAPEFKEPIEDRFGAGEQSF